LSVGHRTYAHAYAWGRDTVEPYDWAIAFEKRVRELLLAEETSAGVEPHGLNPLAVEVMREIGIDISRNSTLPRAGLRTAPQTSTMGWDTLASLAKATRFDNRKAFQIYFESRWLPPSPLSGSLN